MSESPRSVAINSALAAGRVLSDQLGQVRHVRYKGTVDLVTEADEESEQAIVQMLHHAFPEHEILTEESGLRAQTEPSSSRWIVDPLDGTTNFAHGFPLFAVSIAFQIAGEVKLGVVYVPVLDELFVAERGAGVTLNGEPVAVSATDSLIESLIGTGFAYDRELALGNIAYVEHFLPITRGIRRAGSAAIDLCYVACGRYDGYWESGLSPWDTAAGMLMVTEAGGVVTDYAGGEYTLESSTCLASNGRIHTAMQDVLGHRLTHEHDQLGAAVDGEEPR